MDDNLISDSTWSAWATELEELQKKYPDIAAKVPYAEEFKDFDHSTGMNLPLWKEKTDVRCERLDAKPFLHHGKQRR